MKNNKILKLIYNKDNYIKLLIICILTYIIYLLYIKINEGFVTYPSKRSSLYVSTSSIGNKGSTESWIVPDDITQATFTVIGGKGGDGRSHGGFGAKVIAIISVKPGDIYIIGVGSNGISSTPNTDTTGNIPDLSGINPFSNDYFNGGNSNGSGGGGAASIVFLMTSSNSSIESSLASSSITSSTAVIIAGGGGGGGGGSEILGNKPDGYGGNGGINSNGDGGDGISSSNDPADVGNGGKGNSFSNTNNKNVGVVTVGGAGGGGSIAGNLIRTSGLTSGGGAGGSYVNPNSNYSKSFTPSYSTDKTGIPSILIEW